jgi:hypothetical protein
MQFAVLKAREQLDHLSSAIDFFFIRAVSLRKGLVDVPASQQYLPTPITDARCKSYGAAAGRGVSRTT